MKLCPLVELNSIVADGELVAFNVGPEGLVYFAIASAPLDYAVEQPGWAIFPKTVPEQPQQYRVVAMSNGKAVMDVVIEKEHFNIYHVQPLGDGLLLACARSHYARADDSEKNAAQAAELFKEVMEKPDVAGTQSQASLQLAGLYRRGEGVEKNAAKAVELYQVAAKGRNYVAMHELANMYFSGDDVEKSPLLAVQYARLAVSVAPGPQVCLMARLLREYPHLTADKKELYVWSRLAEDAGDCEATDAKAAKKNLSAEEVQEADDLVISMRELWQIMGGRRK